MPEPPRPGLTPCAHLVGGVPRAEVMSKSLLFSAHGFDAGVVFQDRDDRYLDFRDAFSTASDLKEVVTENAGVVAREKALNDAFHGWWSEHSQGLVMLPQNKEMMALRAAYLESFNAALIPVGLLNRFQVAGIIATWWGEVKFDLKALMARDFTGVVEGWVTTIRGG